MTALYVFQSCGQIEISVIFHGCTVSAGGSEKTAGFYRFNSEKVNFIEISIHKSIVPHRLVTLRHKQLLEVEFYVMAVKGAFQNFRYRLAVVLCGQHFGTGQAGLSQRLHRAAHNVVAAQAVGSVFEQGVCKVMRRDNRALVKHILRGEGCVFV